MANAAESGSLTVVTWVYYNYCLTPCSRHREEATEAVLNLAELKQSRHTIAFPLLTTEGSTGTKSYFAKGARRLKQGSVV